MYANTGYLHEIDIDKNDQTQPLVVESCGYYRLVTRPAMHTVRPNGRQDYQMIYVLEGKAHFIINGEKIILHPGHLVCYRPGESQHYSYYGTEFPRIYWIHFSGTEVEVLLNTAGFNPGKSILFPGYHSEFPLLFDQIIWELQAKRSGFSEICCLLLKQLFILISRFSSGTESDLDNGLQRQMEKTVHYFHGNFSREIDIGQYACSLHMSVSWFIRSFRKYTGMSPTRYITSIRLSNARRLLRDSDYSISEISSIVGYDNPLYFSRIFRKYTGVPPSAYRKGQQSQV